MISWIQALTQRHYKWLFSLLLIVMIIAFVFTIGSTPAGFGGDDRNKPQEFFGFNLRNDQQMRSLMIATDLSHRMKGQPLYSNQQLEKAFLERATLLYLADTLNVPQPDTEQFLAFRNSRPGFQDGSGQFSLEKFTRFMDAIDSDPNLTDKQVAMILLEDYRIETVQEALAGPGFVVPHEALMLTLRNMTTYNVDIASWDYSSFQPEIEIAEEELKTFFEDNAANYQIPQKLKVSYLHFDKASYAPSVKDPSEEALQNYYESHLEQFSEFDDFEAAKEAVRVAIIEQEALRAAEVDANRFIETLYDQEIELGSDAFQQQVEKAGLEMVSIEPYSQNQAQATGPVTATALRRAFNLGKRYYSDPHAVDSGAVVVIVEENIAEHIPEFETVADAVEADYRDMKRREQFAERGEQIREQLLEKMNAGTSFSDAAVALDLRVQSYDNFSMDEPPGGLSSYLMQMIPEQPTREVSPMVTRNQEGHFFYVRKRQAPELDPESSEEVAARMLQGAFYSSGYSLDSILAELRAREMPREEVAQ